MASLSLFVIERHSRVWLLRLLIHRSHQSKLPILSGIPWRKSWWSQFKVSTAWRLYHSTLIPFEQCHGESFPVLKRVSAQGVGCCGFWFTEIVKQNSLSWVEQNGEKADGHSLKCWLLEGFITRRKVAQSSSRQYGLSNVMASLHLCLIERHSRFWLLHPSLIHRSRQSKYPILSEIP